MEQRRGFLGTIVYGIGYLISGAARLVKWAAVTTGGFLAVQWNKRATGPVSLGWQLLKESMKRFAHQLKGRLWGEKGELVLVRDANGEILQKICFDNQGLNIKDGSQKDLDKLFREVAKEMPPGTTVEVMSVSDIYACNRHPNQSLPAWLPDYKQGEATTYDPALEVWCKENKVQSDSMTAAQRRQFDQYNKIEKQVHQRETLRKTLRGMMSDNCLDGQEVSQLLQSHQAAQLSEILMEPEFRTKFIDSLSADGAAILTTSLVCLDPSLSDPDLLNRLSNPTGVAITPIQRLYVAALSKDTFQPDMVQYLASKAVTRDRFTSEWYGGMNNAFLGMDSFEQDRIMKDARSSEAYPELNQMAETLLRGPFEQGIIHSRYQLESQLHTLKEAFSFHPELASETSRFWCELAAQLDLENQYRDAVNTIRMEGGDPNQSLDCQQIYTWLQQQRERVHEAYLAPEVQKAEMARLSANLTLLRSALSKDASSPKSDYFLRMTAYQIADLCEHGKWDEVKAKIKDSKLNNPQTESLLNTVSILTGIHVDQVPVRQTATGTEQAEVSGQQVATEFQPDPAEPPLSLQEPNEQVESYQSLLEPNEAPVQAMDAPFPPPFEEENLCAVDQEYAPQEEPAKMSTTTLTYPDALYSPDIKNVSMPKEKMDKNEELARQLIEKYHPVATWEQYSHYTGSKPTQEEKCLHLALVWGDQMNRYVAAAMAFQNKEIDETTFRELIDYDVKDERALKKLPLKEECMRILGCYEAGRKDQMAQQVEQPANAVSAKQAQQEKSSKIAR